MPRPSLKETRREEILDAFMRCVARYGLDGSTLERISKEAGVGRPLLRHYLGNRDEMVAQLIAHVVRVFEQKSAALFQALPAEGRLEALMNGLFARDDHAYENAAVFQALVAASERFADLRAPMLGFVRNFEEMIAVEIRRKAPEAGEDACRTAAAGVTAIYFNVDAIAPLNPGADWRRYHRQAAQQLLDGAVT